MAGLDDIRARIPEPAKDMRLNMQAVLESSVLTQQQVWGIAAATALAARNVELSAAVVAAALEKAGADTVDDARAAASLMAMNNVFYRFRHYVGKESYSQMRAGLRMNRIVKPVTSKADFELMCLAVSAINGCEACVRSHESTVLDSGLTEAHVHDAVRIAAVMHACAVSLEL